MSEILAGTSGWSYDDWKGVVYPPGSSSRYDRLAGVARWCDTIEINSSFYRIPSPKSVLSWLARIAPWPKFRFSAKLYRGLTHDRTSEPAEGLVKDYIGAVGPIYESGRLGAVLAQFPWSFKFSPENMAWIDFLERSLRPLPVAVEVRHAGWLNDDFLGFLRGRRIAFCNIDQPLISGNLGPTDVVTGPFSYVRFHGRNAVNWFKDNEDSADRYNYYYTRDELEDWTARIHRIARETERVYIYMNNHVGGRGLANALKLKSLLGGTSAEAPCELLLAFPDLKEFATACEVPTGPVSKKTGRRSDAGQSEPRENLLF